MVEKKWLLFQSKVVCCVRGIHVKDATDMLTTCSHSIRYHCGILNCLVFVLPRRLLCTTFLSIVCSLVFMPLLITVMGIVLGLGRTENKTATDIRKLHFVVVRINVTQSQFQILANTGSKISVILGYPQPDWHILRFLNQTNKQTSKYDKDIKYVEAHSN